MNNKFLFGAALSALMLTACSQDIIDGPEPSEGAISFAVTNGATSRAAQSHCNTNMPSSFKVSAAKHGTTDYYFEGDVVNKADGSANSYTPVTERYWPEYDLDFHAWTNDAGTYQRTGDKAQFVNFTPNTAVESQLDLLYAVQPNQLTSERKSVKLNFRHALSQIVFAARNESRLNVSITGVSIAHLNTVGTYTLGSTSTEENYENHGDANVEDKRDGLGVWSGVETSALSSYTVNFPEVNVGSTTTDLTSVNHKGGPDKSMILLPQTQQAWAPGQETNQQKLDGYNGAYFVVNVTFKDGEKQVYSGQALVPVNINWQQGRRYKYVFVFNNNGNGGYQPGDPDNPKPILSGITYEVTTDDFVPVDPTNQEMNGEEKDKTYNYSLTVLDGTNTLANITKASKEESYTFTMPEVTTPAKEGYDFAGWLCSADNKVYTTLPETYTVTKNVQSVVFSAQWTEKVVETVYTIHFNGNISSTVYDLPETMTFKSTEKSVVMTLPDLNTRTSGVFFWGWSTNSGATTAEVMFKRAGKVTLTRENPTMTLYAIWGQGTPAGGSGNLEGQDPTE